MLNGAEQRETQISTDHEADQTPNLTEGLTLDQVIGCSIALINLLSSHKIDKQVGNKTLTNLNLNFLSLTGGAQLHELEDPVAELVGIVNDCAKYIGNKTLKDITEEKELIIALAECDPNNPDEIEAVFLEPLSLEQVFRCADWMINYLDEFIAFFDNQTDMPKKLGRVRDEFVQVNRALAGQEGKMATYQFQKRLLPGFRTFFELIYTDQGINTSARSIYQKARRVGELDDYDGNTVVSIINS